ncbi:MAG: nucleoside hydrolase [Kiloniellales bacterium]
MQARPVIIDCDPGQDDAVALLLALASPELEVLGVTAVAGNVPLTLTAKNARRVCELAGRADVPVYAGCPRPILRPLETAEHVHGATGLGGVDLPEPTAPPEPRHAVDFLGKGIPECPLLARFGHSVGYARTSALTPKADVLGPMSAY